MCTISVISGGRDAGFRVVVSRDERRSRLLAEPSRVVELAEGVLGVTPMDPVGGGTWVLGSDRGVVLCLLNSTKSRPGSSSDGATPLRSRGLVIPAIGHARDADSAIDLLRQLDLSRHDAFRLVAIDAEDPEGPTVREARWDGHELTIHGAERAPACFVSSALGDRLVLPRLDLFREMLAGGGRAEELQDAFHAHAWADRRHLSVLMSRPDARTVSITRVQVWTAAHAGARVSMDSAPVLDDGGLGTRSAASIPVQPRGAGAGVEASICVRPTTYTENASSMVSSSRMG